MTRREIRGFYAVLDRADVQWAEWLAARACAIQIRIKQGGAARIVEVARLARRACDRHGALLIINDRVDIALAVNADGVHLGQTDLPIAAAREIGRHLIIGVSTHNIEQVRQACETGADYLGFGPVFATTTKDNPDPVQGIEGLSAAVRASTRPIVAIGGITVDQATAVARTGASAICAISAVARAHDPEQAVSTFRACGIAEDSHIHRR